MKAALFQLDIAWEDKQRNFDKVASLAGEACGRGARLVCLPELFSTGYTMNPEPLAEPLDGETTLFLSRLARKNKISIVGSFIEKTDGKPKNSAVVFDERGERIAHYSKIHLPSFLKEDEHYEAGGSLSVFRLWGTRLSVVICYDLRFPELFRGLVARGVKGVFVIASWPAERIEHWDLLLRARAIENQMFVFGVNRTGSSPIGRYPGHSAFIDPTGRVIVSSGDNREEVLIEEIDFGQVDETREKLPILKDIRPHLSDNHSHVGET